MEISFTLISSTSLIQGLDILSCCFQYAACADDTNSFLPNIGSEKELKYDDLFIALIFRTTINFLNILKN